MLQGSIGWKPNPVLATEQFRALDTFNYLGGCI